MICYIYFNTVLVEYFPRILLRNHPLLSLLPDNRGVTRIINNLIDNLEIDEDDEFDVADFVEELFDSAIDIIARLYERNDTEVQCIARVIISFLDEGALGRFNENLQQVRRAITALIRIGRFLERQDNGFKDIEILSQCVNRFIELSYCDRCTQKTPPLCFSTCNALVRGCYSPYYTVLNDQYMDLWRQVQRIVNLLNETVKGVVTDEVEVLNITAVVCSINTTMHIVSSIIVFT